MKRNGLCWQTLALMAGLVLSVEAHAQESSAEGFGASGQIVISSDFSGRLGYRSVSGPGDEFFIQIQPAVDYFVKESVSLGGILRIETALREGDDPLAVGLGLRAGYHFPLNETVSLWPQIGLGVGHEGDTFLEISLKAPFLVHLAPHFFIGGGPGLITQIGDDTVAELGVSTTVGGYF